MAIKVGSVGYSVEDAINKIGFGRFQVHLILILGLYNMADSIEILLLSVFTHQLACEMKLSHEYIAVISMAMFGGIVVAAPMWGAMADIFGRRPVIFLVVCSTWYFGFITSFSPAYIWVVILRTLVGIGYAGTSQAFVLQGEYLPVHLRGRVLLSQQAFWGIGSCLEIGLAMLVMPKLGWRYLVAFSSLPLLITIFCFSYVPESARYCLLSNRREEANQILQRIARVNKRKVPEGYLLQPEPAPQGQIADLFRKGYWRITILLWIVCFTAAFTYYGIVLLNSEIVADQKLCGGPGKEVPCPYQCTELTYSDYMDMLIPATGEFLATLLNVVLMDFIGRRRTISLHMSLAAVFFFALLACSGRAVQTFFIFMIRTFTSASNYGAYLYPKEVYPTVVRGLGVAFAISIARAGAVVTPYVAQILLHQSAIAAICVYGGISCISAIAAFLLPVETMGRKLQETNQGI